MNFNNLANSVWLKAQTKVVLMAQRFSEQEKYKINILHKMGEITKIETSVFENGQWYKRIIAGDFKNHTASFLKQRLGEDFNMEKVHELNFDKLSEEMLLDLFGANPYKPLNPDK